MKKSNYQEMLPGALFFLGLVSGILFINLWGDTYLKATSIWTQEHLALLGERAVESNAYFLFLVRQRGKWYLLLWLLGHTVAGIPAAALALTWLGFSAGVLLTTAIVSLRLTGILLFPAVLLPQALIYAPLVLATFRGIYEAGVKRYGNRLAFQSWQNEKMYLRLLGFGVPMLLLGAALEAYANPWLLRTAIRYLW